MTRLIPIPSLHVPPDRQRREFDEGKLQELVSSIQERGLLHPIVVRSLREEFYLVAGERRLRAISQLSEFETPFRFDGKVVPPGQIPVVTLGELSDLDAREAELEENIRRVDLSWQERVAAEAGLVLLRERAAKAAGVPFNRDAVVEEIKGAATPSATTAVTQAVILAKNLHRPEVAKAKSQSDAWKAMKRAEEAEKNADLASRLGAEHISAKHTLVQGNCLEWMADQEAGQFDVVCTDPPYGMGADGFGDSGKAVMGEHFYQDDFAHWYPLIQGFIEGITRLAKANSHVYAFCDVERFPQLKEEFEASGWKVFRTPLIWFKPSAFRAPWPEHGPQRKYEMILYARRGELRCTSLAGDVLTYPPDENLGHQAQKPVALFEDLLRRSVRPGMKVLDPFCGTGPVFEAAQALSAFATGVEQDPTACGIAAGRLERLKGGGV